MDIQYGDLARGPSGQVFGWFQEARCGGSSGSWRFSGKDCTGARLEREHDLRLAERPSVSTDIEEAQSHGGGVGRLLLKAYHAVQKLYQDPPAVFARHVSLGTTLRDVARLHGVPWKAVLTRCSALHLSPDLLGRKPDAVSGGELQRISLVRALIPHPRVLLADEPTSRLDPITQRETMALIADVATQEGIAVVLVTHDEDIASAWAERSLSLS
jgi:ABC-type dipeptide/oligopeptide/nickel transport system ATPase subunit